MESLVKVRFAPSPTGLMHLGGLRTAFFNYLFARSHNGQFLLRIEDTDKNRNVPGSIEDITSTLRKFKLDHHGPVIYQSERSAIYTEMAEKLIEHGHAYRCFCSKERLSNFKYGHYDRKCLSIDYATSLNRARLGESYSVRLNVSKVPETQRLKLQDLIIMKSDKGPLYHLASVVDDQLSGITHVIRGLEWAEYIPYHRLLHSCLNYSPVPQFVSLPLILNANRTKLSKRNGDLSASNLLQKGYLPEAILNFVALLGWNPRANEKVVSDIISLPEMIEKFDLADVLRHPAIFDQGKLDFINKCYIEKTVLNDKDKARSLLRENIEHLGNPVLGDGHLDRILEALYPHIVKLSDIPERYPYLFGRPDPKESNDKLVKNFSKDDCMHGYKALEDISRVLGDSNLKDSDSYASIQSLETVKHYKGVVLKCLRLALLGQDQGLAIAEIIYILGNKECKERVDAFINTKHMTNSHG